MTREEVFKQLTDIFTDVFDDDEIEINDQTSAKDIEDWDSLNHINIIVASEKKFQVKFSSKDIRSLSNVGDFVDLILRQTGNAN